MTQAGQAHILNIRGDRRVHGKCCPCGVGYYSLAYRILTIMTYLLVNTSNQVTLPTFSCLQDDLEQLRFARSRYLKVWCC